MSCVCKERGRAGNLVGWHRYVSYIFSIFNWVTTESRNNLFKIRIANHLGRSSLTIDRSDDDDPPARENIEINGQNLGQSAVGCKIQYSGVDRESKIDLVIMNI